MRSEPLLPALAGIACKRKRQHCQGSACVHLGNALHDLGTFKPESWSAEKAHSELDARKRKGIQQELGEQMAEVKARHKQEAAAELAAAKQAEEDAARWKVEENRKEELKKEAMLKLKVWHSRTHRFEILKRNVAL